MKILIAEDDLICRQKLHSFLAKWGYQVVVAADGNEAWQTFQDEEPPELAILDWMMPGIDGVELCQKIRANEKIKGTYIILVTAKGFKEDISAGLKAGADDYITKPFVPEELKTSVQTGVCTLDLQMIQTQNRKKKGDMSDADTLVEDIDELSSSSAPSSESN
jgi:DNA-binding response OmpR family regulator